MIVEAFRTVCRKYGVRMRVSTADSCVSKFDTFIRCLFHFGLAGLHRNSIIPETSFPCSLVNVTDAIAACHSTTRDPSYYGSPESPGISYQMHSPLPTRAL
jgi:hypothetical protein